MVARTRIAGNTGVTRYLQLYTMLSQALADGRIVAGSALPSEPELVREYRVSRTTVRRALARLEDENRIVRRRGSGTYARISAPEETLKIEQSTLLAHSKFLGDNTQGKLLDYERVPTPENVRRTAPEFGETTLRIRCVRQYNKQPLLLVVTYVPDRLTSGLNKRALAHKASLICLQELGARPSVGDWLTSAVGADTFAAKHLKVDINTPLLQTRSVVRDAQGRVVSHEEIVSRPDRVEYRAQMPAR